MSNPTIKQSTPAESKLPVPIVALVSEQPRTLSTDVAAYFGKNHKNVIRDIRTLLADCPEDWGRLNFELSSYINEQGKEQPCYSLTKDGFVLLAMGFTGKEALQWKIKYIEAFNRMEAALLAQARKAYRLGRRAPIDGLSTAADRAPLSALVYEWVAQSVQSGTGPRHLLVAWNRLLKAFEAPNAAYLPPDRLKPACVWVKGQMGVTL